MKKVTTSFLEFRGSHAQFGFEQGERLKDSALQKNYSRVNQPRKRPRYIVDFHKAKKTIKTYMPHLWEELEGLSEGLELPLEETVRDYSGYQQEWHPSGCSILTGRDYLVRNYDYHPKTYEGRFVLFQPVDGYATIGPSQRITGRADGMNEHGLIIGYNFVHRRKPGDGFICNTITRMVLETCKNSEEAADMLRQLPHRHSFNYVLFDQFGTSKVVEATPRGVVVKDEPLSTNHFDILEGENRYHLADSKRRKKLLLEEKSKLTSPYEAFRLFNDKAKGIYSEKYTNWAGTLHTSVYLPTELSVWFAVGSDREPFILSFKDWLLGKDTKVKQLIGHLNTDEELPFMES
ncbi:C45 family autoproteolytic acyltransferase/hydolase [Sediminibacillus terrae]|uniref:C45 family autoproteolytic acyltransferase/hydolase n=1 Tax=Sediminibacillus terrae TaxID=1562106 RepID=UPI0003FE471A|nr:C45 family peptidase [Sediminibacillus terrae]